MSEKYRGMDRIFMECLVSRSEAEPLRDVWRKTGQRRYQFYASKEGVRVDLNGDDKSQVTRIVSSGRAIQYSSSLRQWCAGPIADFPEIVESVQQSRNKFHSRFADLAELHPEVKGHKNENITVAGKKLKCSRIEVRSPSNLAVPWRGEVLIDVESCLVWRAKLSVAQGGYRLQEDIQWTAIQACANCGEMISHWAPPPGTMQIERFLQRLPG
ncbi:MAG TPA: hypothetical protein VFQ91_27980 [Bryobacteraceae bacterium]|nr:hypothetical protein [Bryobacteraceae bacterium]